MDHIEENLKHLFSHARAVAPSLRFRERSLATILSEAHTPLSVMQRIRREFIENLTFGFAIGLAAIFIFVAFGGVSNWEQLIPGNDTRNNAELLSEAASLDFKIQLGEAAYFTQSAEEIAVMVQSLQNEESDRKELEALLQQVVF